MRSRIGLTAALLALATATAPAAPWDILPWFGSDGQRDEDTPIDMKLYLRVGGEAYEIEDDEGGLEEAQEIMARVFPGMARDGSARMESSQVYGMLEELLTDETNHGEALRVAGLNRREHFDVNLILDDHTEPLQPGTVLEVPKRCKWWKFGCKDTYTVKDGDTVESVAEEFGLAEDELRRRNKRRLDIHPHARHEGDIRAVYMGEAGLGKRSDDFYTFMHELGHVGDETKCGAGYGPDGAHRMSEILAPASAFTEGWAQYQAAHLPGRRQRILEDPPQLYLEVETAVDAAEPSDEEDEDDTQYVMVVPRDRTLNDYLGNEARVGSILRALDTLPPGREAVEAAFLEAREDCRSLATVVGAYVAAHPEQADAVREILREWTDEVGTPREYEQVLAGILPRCLAPRDLPRDRDYEPSEGTTLGELAGGDRERGRTTSLLESSAEQPQGGHALGGGGAIGGLFGIGPTGAPRTTNDDLAPPDRAAVVVSSLFGECDS